MIPRPFASALAALLGIASVAGFAAGPAYPLEAGPTGRYLVDQKGAGHDPCQVNEALPNLVSKHGLSTQR